MALHDFFLDRHALASRLRTEQRKTATAMWTNRMTRDIGIRSSNNDEISPAIESGASLGNVAPDSASKQPYLTPEVIESTMADEWCLQYFNVSYAHPIQEAFDDDSSGYVRISEANDFCDSIPEGFSLLQWIAYWARGWHVECARYAERINAMVVVMRSASIFGSVATENTRMIMDYLEGPWWKSISLLTHAACSKAPAITDSPLDGFVTIRMAQKEERLTKELEKWYYTVDTPESMNLICGPARIEKVGVIQCSIVMSPVSLTTFFILGPLRHYIRDSETSL